MENTKLIVLYYPTGSYCDFYESIAGFQIIDISKIVNADLNKKEYKVADGWHPSAKAWEIITPKIIEILNL